MRDRRRLIDALEVTPEFLRTMEGDAGTTWQRTSLFLILKLTHMTPGTVIEYGNWHLSLGRRFRSLKLWFMLRGFGVEGFQANVRKVSRHPIV